MCQLCKTFFPRWPIAKKAGVFFPVGLFESKAGAYPNGALYLAPLKG